MIGYETKCEAMESIGSNAAELVRCEGCHLLLEPRDCELVFHPNTTYPDYWICKQCAAENSPAHLQGGD